MANTKKQTVTGADILISGIIQGHMTIEWPDDQGIIDPDDTKTISKVFDDFASCPAKLKDFIKNKTGLT